ncbi:hypothetical protein J3458_013157 [Metarhizium acridum]|uniref:uncharacterized protein n=1 Tax=Metarhizium acridum TaxID=92637 RepID=UPI001C6BF872|nr:hypothetical protein J3458_013157 [Metarhizium acridum]
MKAECGKRLFGAKDGTPLRYSSTVVCRLYGCLSVRGSLRSFRRTERLYTQGRLDPATMICAKSLLGSTVEQDLSSSRDLTWPKELRRQHFCRLHPHRSFSILS